MINHPVLRRRKAAVSPFFQIAVQQLKSGLRKWKILRNHERPTAVVHHTLEFL